VNNLERRLSKAIAHFWKTRTRQLNKQGKKTGRKDQGARAAVTGGAQLDGMIALISELLLEAGLPEVAVVQKESVVLPGFFRPTKEWDLLVIADGKLLAAIEFKSHCGPSYANNYNNRTEEALGSATDLLAAYREGAFTPSERPWLGFLLLLEEDSASTRPVRVAEPYFKVFPEFQGASYARRYELLCLKLMRERLYDSTCLLLSSKDGGIKGSYTEPNQELSFRTFVTSLSAKASTYARLRTP
jgi:hypothetical protein